MSVSGVAPPGMGSNNENRSAPGELGRDQFLKLLVTQLANQDPLSPMQGTEFVAQLAQFSSLEQLMNVSSRVEALALSQTAAIGTQAVGFVGKSVVSRGGSFKLEEGGGTTALSFELASAAQSGTLVVTDAQGKVVATREIGPQGAGRRTFDFDGKDASGNPLPAGSYSFRVEAKDGAGAAVEATSLSRGVVEAVVYSGGAPKLRVGGREVALGDVMEVSS